MQAVFQSGWTPGFAVRAHHCGIHLHDSLVAEMAEANGYLCSVQHKPM